MTNARVIESKNGIPDDDIGSYLWISRSGRGTAYTSRTHADIAAETMEEVIVVYEKLLRERMNGDTNMVVTSHPLHAEKVKEILQRHGYCVE